MNKYNETSPNGRWVIFTACGRTTFSKSVPKQKLIDMAKLNSVVNGKTELQNHSSLEKLIFLNGRMIKQIE